MNEEKNRAQITFMRELARREPFGSEEDPAVTKDFVNLLGVSQGTVSKANRGIHIPKDTVRRMADNAAIPRMDMLIAFGHVPTEEDRRNDEKYGINSNLSPVDRVLQSLGNRVSYKNKQMFDGVEAFLQKIGRPMTDRADYSITAARPIGTLVVPGNDIECRKVEPNHVEPGKLYLAVIDASTENPQPILEKLIEHTRREGGDTYRFETVTSDDVYIEAEVVDVKQSKLPNMNQ